MSEVGSNSLSRVRTGSSGDVQHNQGLIPVRVKCARCPNRMYKYIKVRQLWAYPPGDSRIMKLGVDRQISVENWCLSCVRAAAIDDDTSRTGVSVNVS
jgi:hypothetical protein